METRVSFTRIINYANVNPRLFSQKLPNIFKIICVENELRRVTKSSRNKIVKNLLLFAGARRGH